MERKLVRQGAGTMMISLPSKWIRENNLGKGSIINLEKTNNDLVISVGQQGKKSETSVKIEGFSEQSTVNLIKNIYKLGYDKITIYFFSEAQFKILQDITRTKLIGFEIVKKESNSCIMENITEPSEEQFDNILSKIFLNGEELFSLLEKKLKKEKNEDDFSAVWDLIEKYDSFCRRVVAKGKLYDIKSEMLWSFITEFVNSLKELYYINEVLIKKNIKVSQETIELLEETKKISEKLIKIYKEKNMTELGQIQQIKENLIQKKGYDLLIKKVKEEDIVIYHLMSCIENLYQTTEVLYGLVL